MTIRQNIAAKQQAVQDVKAHCMCLEYSAGFVKYPEGYWVDGIRFPDTIAGHTLALEVMEKHWKESFPRYEKEMT